MEPAERLDDAAKPRMGGIRIGAWMPHLRHGDRAGRHGQGEGLHRHAIRGGHARLLRANEGVRHQPHEVRHGGDRLSRREARNDDGHAPLQAERRKRVVDRAVREASARRDHVTAGGIAAGGHFA